MFEPLFLRTAMKYAKNTKATEQLDALLYEDELTDSELHEAVTQVEPFVSTLAVVGTVIFAVIFWIVPGNFMVAHPWIGVVFIFATVPLANYIAVLIVFRYMLWQPWDLGDSEEFEFSAGRRKLLSQAHNVGLALSFVTYFAVWQFLSGLLVSCSIGEVHVS